MFFLMFHFSSWFYGVFYRFHALKIPNSLFHHRIMDVDRTKDNLRLLFEEDFFLSQIEHVLFIMVATFNWNMDRYFIILDGSYHLGLAPS
jgi:hypothetical protein